MTARDPGGDREQGCDFGARLLRTRQARGLSQARLAERWGVSIGAVSNFERGIAAAPHPRSLERLVEDLGAEGQEAAELREAATCARLRLWLGEEAGRRAMALRRRAPRRSGESPGGGR